MALASKTAEESTRPGAGPVAAPGSTYVPVRLERERNVVEKHPLAVDFENAAGKIELAKKCNAALWAIPQEEREKLLKQMGYAKEQIRYYMGGLDYFNDYNNAALAQAESLIRNGAAVGNGEIRETMAKSANALAGSILVAYTPYILWNARKGGSEAAGALAQLADAQSYVAYAQMFNLYRMKADINGISGYVAKTNEGLGERYYRLLGARPSPGNGRSLGRYRDAVDDFNRYYLKYSQKQMDAFQSKKEIARARGLEKAYLMANPYLEAMQPLVAAGMMAFGGPGGFGLGALYFGRAAEESFESGHPVVGSLITLTLMAPFFSALEAAPMAVAVRTVGTLGSVAGAGTGFAFQAMMAKDALVIAFDAARMGWTAHDAAALISSGGFMAMPLAGARAAKAARPEEGGAPGFLAARPKRTGKPADAEEISMRGYLDLGYAEEMKGNYDRALEYYGKAIDLSPGDVRGYLFRGKVRLQLNYDWAIEDFTKIIEELDPNAVAAYSEACYYRGLAYLHKGGDEVRRIARDKDYASAIRDFSEAIRRNPSAAAYRSRGDAYKAMGIPERAKSDYAEADRLKKAKGR